VSSSQTKGAGFPAQKQDFKPEVSSMKTMLGYGIPVAAQEAMTGISFMIILALLNGFGLNASAGVGVAEKICALMFIVPGAMMAAVSAFTAQNAGAGQQRRAKEGLYWGMLYSFFAGVLMFVLGYFHGSFLASFFTGDREVKIAAADYLRSYSVDCLIVGFNFCMSGYFTGNGRTLFASLQGILCAFLVRIPFSWYMSTIPGVSLFQIGFATPLATVFGIILSLLYIKFRMKNGGRRNLYAESAVRKAA
jgi:Na+-driven multidrug efflux pump